MSLSIEFTLLFDSISRALTDAGISFSFLNITILFINSDLERLSMVWNPRELEINKPISGKINIDDVVNAISRFSTNFDSPVKECILTVYVGDLSLPQGVQNQLSKASKNVLRKIVHNKGLRISIQLISSLIHKESDSLEQTS